MGEMGKNVLLLCFILLLFLGGVTSAPTATSPAKIVSGVFSNVVPAFMKWLWSMKATTKTVISGRPMMKFESGYTVETVFDGSKLGIEPYSVEVLPSGELLILDSVNSNIYRMSSSLSLYSRPKLVAGSHEGYSGHVDGKLREAKMNHPKGLTVDDRGNIYIADTMNMAIRKISDAGVTTIAGGKWGRGSHVDGASEDAKFSNDFDVLYIGSSCSLLYQSYQQQSTSWPLQDSFVIPDEDEPPSTETRTPTPRKTYPFMSKNTEKMHQWRQGRSIYSGWDGDFQQQQQQQQQHHQQQQQHHQQQQKQQHHHRYQSSTPHTYYEQSYEKTNEIVFGAVQEQDVKHGTTVILPVNYGDPIHNRHNIRPRTNSLH
ncbi:hypothetical protein NC651_024296 [Populus alba x Populus x berolinensis]|nr:hypothetical protein NC651_024296 [Populus alba x Populus x berolinensis]